MQSPDMESRYIPYDIAAESVLGNVLDVLDPERSNPAMDSQIKILLGLNRKTPEDVSAVQRTLTTIGELQRISPNKALNLR